MWKLACVAFAAALFAGTFPVRAACLTPEQRLDPTKISTFLKDRATIFQEFPGAGKEMVSRVRDLVESDPATLKAFADMFPSTSRGTDKPVLDIQKISADQAYAIGSGLADAVLGCTRDSQYAHEIIVTLADIFNNDVQLGYAAIAGDSEIAAGPGGGGGSSGGQISSNPTAAGGGGGLEIFGNNFVPNLSENLFTGGGSSFNGSVSETNNTTVIFTEPR